MKLQCLLGVALSLLVSETPAEVFVIKLNIFQFLRIFYLGANTSVSPAEQAEIVNKHNQLRRGVSPAATNMLQMSWSDEAAANAQKWADGCYQHHSLKSDRKISTSSCGENLYMSDTKDSWSDAIQTWYNEVKDFKYGVGPVQEGKLVGHYTQVVWYRSNKVGCAMATCPNADYKYFYVCQYCPSGNYQLAKPYKSGTTCDDCPNDCNNKLCTNPCPHLDQYSNCASLKQQWGCSGQVGTWCPASCQCANKIM